MIDLDILSTRLFALQRGAAVCAYWLIPNGASSHSGRGVRHPGSLSRSAGLYGNWGGSMGGVGVGDRKEWVAQSLCNTFSGLTSSGPVVEYRGVAFGPGASGAPGWGLEQHLQLHSRKS